jgi:hypothetical protein
VVTGHQCLIPYESKKPTVPNGVASEGWECCLAKSERFR